MNEAARRFFKVTLQNLGYIHVTRASPLALETGHFAPNIRPDRSAASRSHNGQALVYYPVPATASIWNGIKASYCPNDSILMRLCDSNSICFTYSCYTDKRTHTQLRITTITRQWALDTSREPHLLLLINTRHRKPSVSGSNHIIICQRAASQSQAPLCTRALA